ncbi:hypothetical protein DdX_16437 [Ditylenchus destructor]|uniref:Uncharacterized protein n=1 Tax=Ditylenchus destructor TaxID=166010 RepID=A0AAD4QZY0_9BILA|nr:hypothetical protein DdX_16437 [Ditylenchus destructor]
MLSSAWLLPVFLISSIHHTTSAHLPNKDDPKDRIFSPNQREIHLTGRIECQGGELLPEPVEIKLLETDSNLPGEVVMGFSQVSSNGSFDIGALYFEPSPTNPGVQAYIFKVTYARATPEERYETVNFKDSMLDVKSPYDCGTLSLKC